MKTGQEEDKELIAEFKAGNKKAFDRLVDASSGKLYQVAYGILGSHEDAEEVVQDAFIRAYKALEGFRGESSLDTWLHRIVVNLARNKYHWNRRRGAELNISISDHSSNPDGDMEQEDMAIPDASGSPETRIKNNELESLVEKSIEDLPENVRETMVLRHVNEMSYESIAEVLHCKIGTVKSRIARGREMLRMILENIDAGLFK